MLAEIQVYDCLDSTNKEAQRQLAAGTLTQLTCIRARSQTAGRGTQGRSWLSPAHSGLYCSIIHPFSDDKQAPIPITPLFTLAAGVACAETLAHKTQLRVQLKPINDLYLDSCKLGGILVESLIRNDRCKALITGIGINLFPHESLAKTLLSTTAPSNTPTYLTQHLPPPLAQQWQPDALAHELAEALTLAVDTWYQQLIRGKTDTLLETYQQYQLPGSPWPDELKRFLHQVSQPSP